MRLTSIEVKNKLALYFPHRLRGAVGDALRMQDIEEIRIRVKRPIQIICAKKEEIYSKLVVDENDCTYLYEALCQHSVYSCEEDTRQGFITLPECGIRVGISGNVLARNDQAVRFTKVTGFCIRFPQERQKCSEKLCDAVNGLGYGSLLVASPPGVGKTTLLRDMAREISDTYGRKVCIVDERSELAGCVDGVPYFNVGLRTDVIDNCPKAQGMVMAIRSLSPQVLITDELGCEKDYEAVYKAMYSGVFVAASVHALSYGQLLLNTHTKKLAQAVEYVAVLSHKNRIRQCTLYDTRKNSKTEFAF